MREFRPVVVADALQVVAVGGLGIGDGGAAAQRGVFFAEQRVDFAVHAADEEARYRAQQVDGLAADDARFQAFDVGFQRLPVAFWREEQGGIDVHAFGGEAADSFDARQGRRDFDHDVFAGDAAVQFQRFADGFCAVVRDVRRDFKRDHAVGATAFFVHR